MKSVVFVVLISLVTFAAGADQTLNTKLLSSLQSTRSGTTDLIIINDYLRNCSAAFAHYGNCLTENNHNANATDGFEFCTAAAIELQCADSTFAANTTCDGEQDAIDAAGRIRPILETICAALESNATFVVASFFTVIIMTSFSLIQ